MVCEVFRRHVDAVIDGEIDPDTAVEFDRHLHECEECADFVAFAREARRLVRAGRTERAPASLRKRVEASFASAATASTQRWRLRAAVYGSGLAAAAVLVWLSGLGRVTPTPAIGAADDIFEDVVRRHSADFPSEVDGTASQVVGWFRGKLPFRVEPMRFERAGVRLVGARLSNVQARDAAAFYYDVHGRRVTVMVFEPPAPLERFARHAEVRGRGVYYGRARGHTVPVVDVDGLTYAIAGDLDSGSLFRLAASARVGARHNPN